MADSRKKLAAAQPKFSRVSTLKGFLKPKVTTFNFKQMYDHKEVVRKLQSNSTKNLKKIGHHKVAKSFKNALAQVVFESLSNR